MKILNKLGCKINGEKLKGYISNLEKMEIMGKK